MTRTCLNRRKQEKKNRQKLKWCLIEGCDSYLSALQPPLKVSCETRFFFAKMPWPCKGLWRKAWSKELDQRTTGKTVKINSNHNEHSIFNADHYRGIFISSNVIEPSDSEDEDHYPDWRAFYKEPNPRNVRHRWLVQFYDHLQKPDNGRKKNKSDSYCRRLMHSKVPLLH